MSRWDVLRYVEPAVRVRKSSLIVANQNLDKAIMNFKLAHHELRKAQKQVKQRGVNVHCVISVVKQRGVSVHCVISVVKTSVYLSCSSNTNVFVSIYLCC